jgi:hypothetical protein
VIFVATKKVGQHIFFSSLSFVTGFGSVIRDRQKSGSGIRDKHPGSATLGDHKILFDADLIVQFLLKCGLIPLVLGVHVIKN